MTAATPAFITAHAADSGWQELTHDCIAQLGDAARRANLGFVYVTDALAGDMPAIVAALHSGTGIADWVGTVGYGVCVSGQEYFDRPAIVLMAATLPANCYRILPTLTRPGEEMAGDLPGWSAAARPLLGVLHADPRNPNLPGVLDSLYDDTDGFMVGGLTASRGANYQVAGELSEGGLSGVLMDKSVRAVSALTQGCSPISDVFEVTKGRDNVVMELEGRPALDVLRDSIGEVLARDMSRIAGYVHAALPISGADTGDYLVRNLMGIDPRNGWVLIGERIGKGDRLMFVRRDAPSALKDLNRMLDDVTGRAETTPRAALYFSCIARGPNQFGKESEELKTIAQAIGNVPLVGFFANGEISNSRLYGYTGVLTLIL